ncbi:MAG: hypothetical protein LBT50_02885 [Prevotellaceae bacterium]|jgi:hypothetical protein|nr:hypothetical protein [Prevotellaceae bacterium]
MAKQEGNVVTHGLRGKVGDLLVFRQLNGKTVISKVPQPSKKVSAKQKAHRKHFQRAVMYSSVVVADPDQKAMYEAAAKKGQTARNVAVADMLNAPDIENVDLSGYNGQIGDVIRIEATDDFAVKEVKVIITNADGTLVEEGAAQPDGMSWVYTATQTNDDLNGDKIEILASDIPGNIAKESQDL